MTVVYLAVEGDADIPIAERLIRIPGLVRSAAHINWLILRDLDREPCAPDLIRRLFVHGIPPRVSLRIAVRSMESWLLADQPGFAEAFSVRRHRLPDRPDELENAKLYLVNVCRSSRQTAIRSTIPPRPGQRTRSRSRIQGTENIRVEIHSKERVATPEP